MFEDAMVVIRTLPRSIDKNITVEIALNCAPSTDEAWISPSSGEVDQVKIRPQCQSDLSHSEAVFHADEDYASMTTSRFCNAMH